MAEESTNTEETKVPEINKDTTIGELLQIDMGVGEILMAIGMHCFGCPASQMETIEEASYVHGVDPQSIVDEINDYFLQKAAGTA